MTTIAVDGLNEETFRRVIEGRLRQGKPAEAIDKLRSLLEPYAGPGKILPARFLTVQSSDFELVGWESLGEAIARRDQPGWPITALTIAFGWPGEDMPAPDSDGRLRPLLETAYFTDRAFPFSQSARADLLDGYSYHGCTWADEGEASDDVLSLAGIDDLHGALAALEGRLLDSEEPDEEEIRAGSLGACLLSALLVKAVGERIARDGLPRPVCVMAGSNGVYPYFDAPIVGMPADVLKAAEAAEEDEIPLGQGVPGPRYSSLLVTGIPRARKRAVLVLDETAEETALRNANLRNLSGRDEPAVPPRQEERPAALSAEPDANGIVPMPGGPLMAKRPHKPAWDFRDMLGPRDGDPPPSAPADATDWDDWDDLPEPDTGSVVDRGAVSEPEQPVPPVDLPQVVSAPTPELAEPEVQPVDAPIEAPVNPAPAEAGQPKPFGERLPRIEPDEPVIAAFPADSAASQPGFTLLDNDLQERLKALVASPAVSESIELEAPAPATPKAQTLPEGPVWCFGIGWLEDAEEAVAAAQAAVPPLPDQRPSGLWARLSRWLRRQPL